MTRLQIHWLINIKSLRIQKSLVMHMSLGKESQPERDLNNSSLDFLAANKIWIRYLITTCRS